METTYHLNFKLERADHIAVNTLMVDINPEWKRTADKMHRKEMIGAYVLAVIFFTGISVAIGLMPGTRGMYLEGAIAGALLGGVTIWGVSRMNQFEKLKSRQIQRVRGADFSSHCGEFTVRADGESLQYAGPAAEAKVPWKQLTPRDTPQYLLLLTPYHNALTIPKSAFPSADAARTFYADALRWHTIATPSPAQRVALYLADRDLPCPKCKYNLRGVESINCPECGEELTVEKLSAIPQ